MTFAVGGSERKWKTAEQRTRQANDSLGFEAGVLYAMAYIPSPSGVETERANSLAELYADARPGYALYTFILGGPVGAQPADDNADTYSELLRVIETYVANDESVEADSGFERHGFLVQVDATRADGALTERVRPGLSRQIQSVLARQLRLHGQFELSERLDRSPGPFLVTSLRPTVLPRSARTPLLVVDLQDIGPEYMYSLIDAYDRPIPGDLSGRPESLAAIERRLRGMFPKPQIDRGAPLSPLGDWIWRIGEQGPMAEATTSEEEG
ncbi:hypothetical protein CCR82_05630 [Halochromatium salexigens]|uniref:Uncharacterized protein n=1 Tax=Halochromatium salexigens TaxID=49447 RepID=A0AAJ0UEK8_HALSE|nr:hypothetical protein [Halochromatium salexigens]